jgi:hypothetical protein
MKALPLLLSLFLLTACTPEITANLIKSVAPDEAGPFPGDYKETIPLLIVLKEGQEAPKTPLDQIHISEPILSSCSIGLGQFHGWVSEVRYLIKNGGMRTVYVWFRKGQGAYSIISRVSYNLTECPLLAITWLRS